MNTRNRRAVLGMLLLVVTAGIVQIWPYGAELAEAFEASACRIACRDLTAEQLRLEVVKAYLHRELDTNIERHDFGGNYQLALLPHDLTAQDVARSIQDATLLNLLTTDATILGSHGQIDALTVESLASNPSIADYTLNQREAGIIPIRGIREASRAEIEAYFRGKGRNLPQFTRWERLRGYGQHYFWINPFWTVSLACCDGQGDKNGLSRDWLNQNSLRDVTSSRPQLMAVSDRGAILIRTYQGERLFLF